MPAKAPGVFQNFVFYTKLGWVYEMDLSDTTTLVPKSLIDDGSVSPDTFDMVIPATNYSILGIMNSGTPTITLYWYNKGTITYAASFTGTIDPVSKVFFYYTSYEMMFVIAGGYGMSIWIDDWNAVFDAYWVSGTEQFDIVGAVYTS